MTVLFHMDRILVVSHCTCKKDYCTVLFFLKSCHLYSLWGFLLDDDLIWSPFSLESCRSRLSGEGRVVDFEPFSDFEPFFVNDEENIFWVMVEKSFISSVILFSFSFFFSSYPSVFAVVKPWTRFHVAVFVFPPRCNMNFKKKNIMLCEGYIFVIAADYTLEIILNAIILP